MISQMTHAKDLYISSDYLISFKDFCLSSGIDLFSRLATIKDGERLSEKLLAPSQYIEIGTLFQIYQHVGEITKKPLSTAWDFAQWQSAKNAHGTLGLAIRNARNFMESVELMMRFGRLRTNFSTITLTIEDDKLFFSISENNFGSIQTSREPLQFTLSSYLFNAESFLRRSIPEAKRGYQSYLYLEDKIENKHLPESANLTAVQDEHSGNTLCIPLDTAKTQFTTYNPRVLERLLPVLESELQALPQQSYQGKLRDLLRQTEWQEISIEAFAEKLNLSVSTLQRKLREEGLTFYDIKHQERVKAAKELLSVTSQTLQEISDTLGYSNTSNFTKSFRTSEHCSPQQFRLRHQLKF